MQFPWFFLLTVTIAAFLLTGLTTWFVTRQGMLDLPGERHSHLVATPRGGGLGIVLAVLVMTWLNPLSQAVPVFWWHCLAPGFAVLALVGFLDDRFSLSVPLRLLVQLTASLYLLACGQQSGWTLGIWLWIAAPLFLVWMTNLYNFMDGSNGMAAMQGVFAGLVIAVLFYQSGDTSSALLAATLAAACTGFLPWNLGNARVFMGDAGSIALGYLLAGLLVFGVMTGAFASAVAWMVMLVFICDSSLTLAARVIRGERWYTPHKQHIYQRLIANGWSHNRVMWLYQLINFLLVIPVIVVAVSYPEWAEVIAISTTLALAIAWFLALRKFGVLA
ncbi:MAG TPA: glycosyltransferase family 4 protein [Xanthomonadales bacterium]|nr:glycosyltransferase family 4 protein [Xanthomonadales bacterium]